MTIFWNANAVRRSAAHEELLALSEPSSDTDAVVQAWRRNLRAAGSEADEEAEIEAIVERHPRLFGHEV